MNELVARLRTAGGDYDDVEVKSAAGGLPQSLASTLSALANHPGGGTIILGLDEATGFRPVQLSDPASSQAGPRSQGALVLAACPAYDQRRGSGWGTGHRRQGA